MVFFSFECAKFLDFYYFVQIVINNESPSVILAVEHFMFNTNYPSSYEVQMK